MNYSISAAWCTLLFVAVDGFFSSTWELSLFLVERPLCIDNMHLFNLSDNDTDWKIRLVQSTKLYAWALWQVEKIGTASLQNALSRKCLWKLPMSPSWSPSGQKHLILFSSFRYYTTVCFFSIVCAGSTWFESDMWQAENRFQNKHSTNLFNQYVTVFKWWHIKIFHGLK